jgi:hypothetical protein
MDKGSNEQQIEGFLKEQEINIKQLMATGDLEINDAKLKDYVAQRGLRTAILKVIKVINKITYKYM